MANIGSLLVLLILIYSILGVYLFAEVKQNGELNDHANFTNIGSAILTLIRAMSGEKWPLIMNALSRKEDLGYSCIQNPSYQDYINNNSKSYPKSNPLIRDSGWLRKLRICNSLFLLLHYYGWGHLHSPLHRCHNLNIPADNRE